MVTDWEIRIIASLSLLPLSTQNFMRKSIMNVFAFAHEPVVRRRTIVSLIILSVLIDLFVHV